MLVVMILTMIVVKMVVLGNDIHDKDDWDDDESDDDLASQHRMVRDNLRFESSPGLPCSPVLPPSSEKHRRRSLKRC